MPSYRIHRLKDHLRQAFRSAPHVAGAALLKPRDYEPGDDRRVLSDEVLVGVDAARPLVQHQPLARREAHAKTPVLPANLLAIDLVTGAIGLDDLQVLQAGPGLADVFAAPVACLGGQGGDTTARI